MTTDNVIRLSDRRKPGPGPGIWEIRVSEGGFVVTCTTRALVHRCATIHAARHAVPNGCVRLDAAYGTAVEAWIEVSR